MGNELNEHCDDLNRILRHERELGEMASVTRILADQNTHIADSLKEFNKTVTDLTIVISQQQDSISSVEKLSAEMGTLNTNIFKLENTIFDLKKDITDRDQRIDRLEDSTSHIKWLNDGVKTVTSKVGYMVILAFLGLVIANGGTFMKILKTISVQIGF